MIENVSILMPLRQQVSADVCVFGYLRKVEQKRKIVKQNALQEKNVTFKNHKIDFIQLCSILMFKLSFSTHVETIESYLGFYTF